MADLTDVQITLKIPQGYYEMGKFLSVFYGNKSFDEYVGDTLIEAIDTLVDDPLAFNQEVKKKLGKL